MATINRFVTLLFLLFAVMGALMLQGCGKEEEKAPAGADADQGGGGGGDTEIEEEQPKKKKKKKRKKGDLTVDADDDEYGAYADVAQGNSKKAKRSRKETRKLAKSKGKGAAHKKGAQRTKLHVDDSEGYGDDLTKSHSRTTEDTRESDEELLTQYQDDYADKAVNAHGIEARLDVHEDHSEDERSERNRAEKRKQASEQDARRRKHSQESEKYKAKMD